MPGSTSVSVFFGQDTLIGACGREAPPHAQYVHARVELRPYCTVYGRDMHGPQCTRATYIRLTCCDADVFQRAVQRIDVCRRTEGTREVYQTQL